MRWSRVLTAHAITRAAVLGVPVVLAAPLTGCTVNTGADLETETRTVAVEHRSGPIDVATENGAVVVRARPGATEVTINAEVRARTQERLAQTVVVAERTGEGALRLRVRWPEERRYGNEGVSFDIALPDATGATIDTKNGRIEIVGLSGEARLTTSNGRIMVEDHRGSVFATTSNGRIEVEGVQGSATLRTTNGRVVAEDVRGGIEARTSNGAVDIRLHPGNPGPVKASTSNGAISFKAGRGLAATLDLSTSNGKIVVRKGGETMEFKKTARVEINGGGPTGTLSTSNGSITVRISDTDE